ncbi:hypothetical protein Y1Q_0004758 [Alligator mississippiensis]|uniref:Uncharacterized protein n=1 Tax=Alligator mississippiensis TaxID=8496 RepID=A0A151NLI7_ALLMI|nr:hypothetical protein Y1Q_0004758 [Alligator mississippiensis]
MLEERGQSRDSEEEELRWENQDGSHLCQRERTQPEERTWNPQRNKFLSRNNTTSVFRSKCLQKRQKIE